MVQPLDIETVPLRGCGKRKPGGVYLCTGQSIFGRPVEEFLIDPPYVHHGTPFRTPIFIEHKGIYHLLIWVGAEHYPYPSDFWEEARRYGVSRRVPVNFPLEKLSSGSRMFFIHSRAIIENYNTMPQTERCPKDNPIHLENKEYCLGHIYQVAEAITEHSTRIVGSTEYTVDGPVDGFEPEYQAGIFMSTPITHIDYIRREDGTVDNNVVNKDLDLPIFVKDE